MMLFSGFFLNANSVPNYFTWLEHISFMKYAFAGASIAIFQDNTFHCVGNQFRDVVVNGTSIMVCPITSGDAVLVSLGLNSNFLSGNLLILMGMIIFYYLVGYVALRLSKKG